ncbi:MULTISPECIES: hypothetical protein [Mycobacteriaceae]|uniref:Uncharacterized protein n=1 Tax=Mycobacteroides salmoniphilum TaxID=404941 RepID=A0A4R8SDP0_9MYCO|nr:MULTISPECIES: hypothetical protein [Mycobacteriaceae]TDZ93536.1 hypothetical protein CCUG60885_03139 [Mycobacteroides salmoniphilum]TEA09319.1 hypothetical protein CCUG60883_00080 [Mycobacteroides salmoniphilum]
MSADQLVTNAKSGALVLHLEDGAIDNILAACDAYIQALGDLFRDASDLSTYQLGFAEGHLSSGAQLAQAFQAKASGGKSSAASSFQSHIDQVEEMKTLFVALRRGYQSTEANNTTRFGPHGQ